MKYVQFEASDVKGVNAFLKDHSDGISPDGTKFVEGKVYFLYLDMTKEERETENLAESVRQSIRQEKAALLGADLALRLARLQTLAGIARPADVVDKTDLVRHHLKQVKSMEMILQEVLEGKWDPTPA